MNHVVITYYHVCIQVNGILQGVPQGSYRVQWRMRISLSARWNEPLDFTVSVMEVYKHKSSSSLQHATADFFVLGKWVDTCIHDTR